MIEQENQNITLDEFWKQDIYINKYLCKLHFNFNKDL